MLSIPAAGVILLLAWIYPSYALYFHIGETEKKCFIEEIPDETMVIGKLRCTGIVSLTKLTSSARQQLAPEKVLHCIMTLTYSSNGSSKKPLVQSNLE